jgi:hypothetical protein
MDIAKKKKYRNTEKETSRYRDRKLETTTLTPPRQHQKISFSIKPPFTCFSLGWLELLCILNLLNCFCISPTDLKVQRVGG